MRLELGCIHIKDIRFGAMTSIESGVLTINRAELISLLQQEPLFERVDIEIAHPGESCRILRVLDVLEPRYRLNGPNFPGALDGNGLVGDGATRALKNVAVVETDQTAPRSRSLIDMSGPAADYSPIANTHNVVLLAYPKKDVDRNDYRLAVKKAGLKTAVYLAAAAKDLQPDETQVLRTGAGGGESGAEGTAAHRLHFSHALAPASDPAERDGLLRQQHPGLHAHRRSSQ